MKTVAGHFTEIIVAAHEEVAASVAASETHLIGDLDVCARSCGPGNLHVDDGLFDCPRSRVPVFPLAAAITPATTNLWR